MAYSIEHMAFRFESLEIWKLALAYASRLYDVMMLRKNSLPMKDLLSQINCGVPRFQFPIILPKVRVLQ